MNPSPISNLAERLDRLEGEHRQLRRQAHCWRNLSLLAFAIAAVVLWGGAGRQEERARPAEKPQANPADPIALAQSQRRLARSALNIIERATADLAAGYRQLLAASTYAEQWLGAELYLAQPETAPRTLDPEVFLGTGAIPTEESLDFFEEHRARLVRWENQLRPLSERGVISRLDFLHIQWRRVRAEIWLAWAQQLVDAQNPEP